MRKTVSDSETVEAKRLIKFTAGAVLLTAVTLLLVGRHIAFDAQKSEYKETAPAYTLSDEPVTEFSKRVIENENGESVFDISAEEFIRCYNRVYFRTYESDYLKSMNSENWYCFSELSPRFGYESVRCEFSEDRTVWPMPTISLYVADGGGICEIRVTFDDHGYQEKLYIKYKELCSCLLKIACPEMSDNDAMQIVDKLYSMSDENFFGDHHWYGDPERPSLSRLLQNGSTGFYCFYGPGTVEICMIPLSQRTAGILEAEGTDIQDMQMCL